MKGRPLLEAGRLEEKKLAYLMIDAAVVDKRQSTNEIKKSRFCMRG